MSNPNKAKGTRHESKVRDATNEFLAALGEDPALYRPAQTGHKDVGDIHGVDPFILQCKDYRDLATALREGVDGAVLQAENAGRDHGVAVVKRARRPIGEAYAVMRYEDFVRVWLRLRRAEDGLDPQTAREHVERVENEHATDFPR